MEIFIVIVFILGYAAVAFEESLKVDKLVPALIMMAIMWAAVSFGLDGFNNWFDSGEGKLVSGFSSLSHEAKEGLFEGALLHHLGKTCEILIFLIGAMTIVEIIDHFNGFATIKGFVKTNNKKKLLWIVAILAFFLSAVIDNLTATIVLITILRKLLPDHTDRMWFAGFIIISANAGGAWSPIGDVTTTMLWIGKKVSTLKLIEYLIAPSLISMIVPVFIGSFLPIFKGTVENTNTEEATKHGKLMLYLGIGMIVFVPIFKSITHLPPYIGMMLSFSVVAIVAEIITRREFEMARLKDDSISTFEEPIGAALPRIEMPSVLFFLGILMAVAALESIGAIFILGQDVQSIMSNELFILILGAGSAIVDNVPLVAASMGMFDGSMFPMDDHIWHFIAFAAGTGGSLLIIGSAAGVVAMGMEKIPFFWYMKKFAWLAAIGYLAGYGFMMLVHN